MVYNQRCQSYYKQFKTILSIFIILYIELIYFPLTSIEFEINHIISFVCYNKIIHIYIVFATLNKLKFDIVILSHML